MVSGLVSFLVGALMLASLVFFDLKWTLVVGSLGIVKLLYILVGGFGAAASSALPQDGRAGVEMAGITAFSVILGAKKDFPF